ncbi:hypothetical protein [Dactylosporangium cerinum]
MSAIAGSSAATSVQVSPRSWDTYRTPVPSAVRVAAATRPGRAVIPGRSGAGAASTRRTSSCGNRPAGSQPAPLLVERNTTSPQPAYQVPAWNRSATIERTEVLGASSTTNRTSST